MPKMVNMLNSKKCKRKIKSWFIIHAHFKSLLVPEDNAKQNAKGFACSYGYKLVMVLIEVVSLSKRS